jgi:hypothetical protein
MVNHRFDRNKKSRKNGFLVMLSSNRTIIAAGLPFVPSKCPGACFDPPLFTERLAIIFQGNQGYATFFMEQRDGILLEKRKLKLKIYS